MRAFFILSFLTFLIPSPVFAQVFDWQSNNIQLLHGGDFELTKSYQTTLTFEHADSWKYGDNFFYIDYPINVSADTNFEFSPRLSLNKITGADLSAGILKDILIAGTWEKARRFDAYLYGVGFDLALPGFNFLQANFYVRDNPDADDKGLQTTWAWSAPFTLGGQSLTFDGYFDYADYEEGDVNFFTQPQLLLDIGQAFNITEPGHAWAGIEYRYWHNKFGIEGVTESAPQAMVKWVF